MIGGTGLIGSKVVTKLTEHGHEAVAASPNTGVNTLTGEGLAEVPAGAQVVVDVSNSPSFERAAVMEFFETSTRNLQAAEGVGHHVALSVVGTERMPDNGYFAAKIAQEQLIEKSGIPFSLVHMLRLCLALSARYARCQAYYFGDQGDGSAWLVAERGKVVRRYTTTSDDLPTRCHRNGRGGCSWDYRPISLEQVPRSSMNGQKKPCT
ncbi:SDR family oxidoreductase [Nonomuraea endophytica]|uniref:SDR family oxidoreductase n=1 Tax=Nonomuraea endophytica TaxID=714136 RepID=UPI0037C94451